MLIFMMTCMLPVSIFLAAWILFDWKCKIDDYDRETLKMMLDLIDK